MASDRTWSKVAKYFRKHSRVDNWGDPDIINDEHLLKLFDFREWVGSPVIVTAGVKKGGHAKKSFHYVENGACATDVILPKYEDSPFDLVLDATRFGFTGIGYYPHWRFNGEKVGGLHLDSRPLKWDADETINYAHSRWMGIMEGDKQTYIELSFQNLLDYTTDAGEHIGNMH